MLHWANLMTKEQTTIMPHESVQLTEYNMPKSFTCIYIPHLLVLLYLPSYFFLLHDFRRKYKGHCRAQNQCWLLAWLVGNHSVVLIYTHTQANTNYSVSLLMLPW